MSENSNDNGLKQSKSKVPNDFPPYDIKIINTLYKNGLVHYTLKIGALKYPLVQNVGLYKHCLMCAESISSELFHCNSNDHIKNTKDDHKRNLLMKYHKVFVQLPVEYQDQQKYFRKDDLLICILCNVGVDYDHELVCKHVECEEHISRQKQFEGSPNTSCGNSPDRIEEDCPDDQVPKQKRKRGTKKRKKNKVQNQSDQQVETPQPIYDINFKYTSPAIDKLFKNLEKYTFKINDTEYYYLRHSILGIRCLLCNDGPALSPEDHIKTGNHVQLVETQVALDNLIQLHQHWMTFDYMQSQMFYIVQRRCFCCHVSLKPDDIFPHVFTKQHFDMVLSVEMIQNKSEKLIEEQTNVNQSQINNKNPQGPEVVPNKKDNSNGVSVETTIQHHQPNAENLDAEITLNYYSWLKAIAYGGLAQYTINLDGINYPLLRRTVSGLRCILCDDALVDNISDHLNSEEHLQQMSDTSKVKIVHDYHDHWTTFMNDPYSQRQQIYIIKDRCHLCLDYTHTTDVTEHLASKEHRMAEEGLESDKLFEDMGLSGKFSYCAEVEKALYSDLKQYFTYLGPIKLTFLRHTKEGIRCILCDDAGVRAPAEHVKTSQHEQALKNGEKIEKLWNFHRMWQKMSPGAQMHQQYVILMMCTVCDKKLNVATAEAHVLSKPHERNISSKEKQKANQKPKPAIKHDIMPSISNPDPEKLLTLLPKYFSPHMKILKPDSRNLKKVNCTVCKIAFDDAASLRSHLDSDDHSIATNIDLIKIQFLCEICMRKLKSEHDWMQHLGCGNHTSRVKGLGDSRKSKLQEYMCVTCNMVFFGDSISVMRHNMNKSTNGAVEITLSKAMKQLLASRKLIINKGKDLLKAVEQNSFKSRADVDRCCKALETALSAVYPSCRAYPFGSRVTGLGNSGSDLDVFFDIGNTYDGSLFQSPEDQANIVEKVGELLKRNKHFANVDTVPGARTPIVKVFHIDTEIDCDISFRHGLSVENTEFIRFCIQLQPIVKPALLFLKEWLSKTDLPYGTPTSYAFNLMFIFFMQNLHYLLSVKEIRNYNKIKDVTIDGWEVIEYTESIEEMRKHVKQCSLALPDLLHKFFEFYETFNFGSFVVCPLTGQKIAKAQFFPDKLNLPRQMATYLQKLKSPNAEELRHHTPMCVQDPFDLSHNVTKGCSGLSVKMFQKYCRLSKLEISALNENREKPKQFDRNVSNGNSSGLPF